MLSVDFNSARKLSISSIVSDNTELDFEEPSHEQYLKLVIAGMIHYKDD